MDSSENAGGGIVNPPPGYRTVNALLMVADCRATIRFIEQGFGGVVRELVEGPGGSVAHCALTVGDSTVILGDANDKFPLTRSMLYLYVDDVDATYARAVTTGGESIQPPEDRPYGDRNAAVRDADGNQWWIATHVENVTEEEIARRFAALESS